MRTTLAFGVARLARFDAGGLAAFDATPAGLMNALAPWIAFALVGFVLALFAGPEEEALGDLLGTLVWLLAPAVLSDLLARLWGRKEAWLRYAVAFTWCQWIMPPALLVAVAITGVLVAAEVPDELAERLGALALLIYALALHGFLARRALDISRWRAAAIVAIVDIGSFVLVFGPLLVRVALESPA